MKKFIQITITKLDLNIEIYLEAMNDHSIRFINIITNEHELPQSNL